LVFFIVLAYFNYPSLFLLRGLFKKIIKKRTMANCRKYPPFNEIEKDGACVRQDKVNTDKNDTLKGILTFAVIGIGIFAVFNFALKK
jgi:hypothetical protein